MTLHGIPITLIDTVYPAPADDEADYCPDGESDAHDTRMTFCELVRLIRGGGYSSPSSFPIASPGARDWLCVPDMEPDYRTGDLTARSLHLSVNATAREAKYWAKAWRAAGVRCNRGAP